MKAYVVNTGSSETCTVHSKPESFIFTQFEVIALLMTTCTITLASPEKTVFKHENLITLINY